MFYTMREVKNAVDIGFLVKWKNDSYDVVKDNLGNYLIGFCGKGWVGLESESNARNFYVVGEWENQ